MAAQSMHPIDLISILIHLLVVLFWDLTFHNSFFNSFYKQHLIHVIHNWQQLLLRKHCQFRETNNIYAEMFY